MSRFLQVLLTIAGLGITLILGYASMRSDSQQAQSALLGLFTETLTAARDKCDAEMFDIAEDALERVKSLETSRLFVTPMEEASLTKSFIVYEDALAAIKGTVESEDCIAANSKVASGSTGVPDESPTAPLSAESEATSRGNSESHSLEVLSKNAQTRTLKETAQTEPPVSQPEPPPSASRADGSSGPIAVLASYAISNQNTFNAELGVSRHFEELKKQIRLDGTFELKLLRASISNHFAIALVPIAPTSENARDEARRLVTLARREGWAPDAFVQVRQSSANWGECTNPTGIDNANDC